MDPIFAAWSKSNIRPVVRDSLFLSRLILFNRGGGFVEIVLLESHSGGPFLFFSFSFSTRFNYPATSFVSAVATDFVRFLHVDPSRKEETRILAEEHVVSSRFKAIIDTVGLVVSCFLLAFLFMGFMRQGQIYIYICTRSLTCRLFELTLTAVEQNILKIEWIRFSSITEILHSFVHFQIYIARISNATSSIRFIGGG